jgi:hypothetical protein
MMDSGLTKTAIDDYLQKGLDGDHCTSFQSADELWELLENIEFGFGPRSWTSFEIESGTLWTRNILHCIQLLLGHLPFADHTVYGPSRLFDSNGGRIYNEIHTGNWWWEMQDMLPEGGTLVPLIFASDKTHLTNFSGDKSAWPLYMSLGNINKEIRRQSSKRAWVLLSLLPIAPKNPETGEIHETWHKAVHKVLEPVKGLDLRGQGYSWDCSDGNVRHCYPIVAAWISDYMEYVVLGRLISGNCPVCEIPKNEMGHESGNSRNKGDGIEYPRRDKAKYQRELEVGGARSLAEYGLQSEANPLWEFPACDPYKLWQPDILHLLHLGIVKVMMEWVTGYMKDHGMLDRFNERFKSMPAYPGFARPRRSYDEVSAWQGKEMRTMMQFLLALLGPLLTERITGGTCPEAEALACVRSMSEFLLVVGQWSHSDYMITLLRQLLERFYQAKSAFRDQRATKARKIKFNTMWNEILQEAMELGWSESRIEAERVKLRKKIFHFQFPKMHLLSHIAESISYMGSPDNFSTDVSELLHIEMVKEAYRASNRVNFQEQMLWYNDRNTSLGYMIQSLEYLALRGNFDPDTACVLGMTDRADRLKGTRMARRRQVAAIASSHSSAPRNAASAPRYLPFAIPKARVGANRVLLPTTVAGRARAIKPLSLTEAEERFEINDLARLFRDRAADVWGLDLTERILGPANGYANRVHIEVYNSVADYYQPFQRPLLVEKRFLRCSKDENTKRGLVTHDIWVRVNTDRTQDSFQGRQPCRPLLYFCYTPPEWASQVRGPGGQCVATREVTKSMRGRAVKVSIPQRLELVMLMGYKFAGRSSLPNKFHGLVEVELNRKDRYVADVEVIEGPVHLVDTNETRSSRKRWVVNSHIDLETYYYVY